MARPSAEPHRIAIAMPDRATGTRAASPAEALPILALASGGCLRRTRLGFRTSSAVGSCAMLIAALLSAIHMLTLALGAGGLFARGLALSSPLDDAGWKRLLAADNAWGIAAVLWIASGFGRVFYGGKEPSYYWRNGFFWVKLALFGMVFALE